MVSSRSIPGVIVCLRLRSLMLVFAYAGMILYMPACDEALPPYVAPAAVIVYGLSISGNDVVVNEGNVTSGGIFILTAKNVSDEVLSDNVRLIGSLTIRLRGKPGTSRTLIYTLSDLLTHSMVVGSTLNIEPNQALSLIKAWDHCTATDIPFWNKLAFTQHVTEKGVVYYQSETAWLQVAGSLKLFDKVQAVKLPLQEFPVVYYLFDTFVPPPPTRNQ